MFPPWFHSPWVTRSKQLYTIRVTQRVRKLPSDLNREEEGGAKSPKPLFPEKLILADGRRVGGDIRTLGLLDWIRLGADSRENINFYRILQVIYLFSWGLQTLRRLKYTFKQFNHFIYRVRVSWSFFFIIFLQSFNHCSKQQQVLLLSSPIFLIQKKV